MGQEWLTKIVELLSKAGIASGEEFASAPVRAVSQPVAAVGLAGLDWEAGTATVTARILSPRSRGGWACQTTAAKAVSVLEEQKLRAGMGKMEYLPGCDCFQVTVTAVMQVRERPQPPVPPVEPPEKPLRKTVDVRIGEQALAHVVEFTESCSLDRRLIGSHGQGSPAGITPGSGGWEIRLVQQIPDGEPEQLLPAEPFACSVTRGTVTRSYSGCCWDRTRREYGDGMLTVECRGFALERRETVVG